MKAIKFLVMFCFVTFSGFQVLGQIADTPKQVENKVSNLGNENKVEITSQQTGLRNQSNEKYRIGFQDSLEIRVAKHEELSVTINVGPDGKIRLPRIDEAVVAVCKTEDELKNNLETLYKNYLKNPYVNVRVVDYRSQPVAVIGAVEKPGTFNLNRKVRLLELLAFAGGEDVETAGSKVQIARVGNTTACVENTPAKNDSEEVEFLSYKLNDVRKGIVNPLVQPGDIVSVLVAEEAYVVGDVKEPTKVSLKETVTLTQAIAAAGGMGSEAKTSKVRIQRQEANSPLRTELMFDLKDIAAKKISDPVLQANDIVEVPKNGVKQVRNGILKALSGGVGGLLMGL